MTFLFVHGWSFTPQFWDPVRQALAAHPQAPATTTLDLGFYGAADWAALAALGSDAPGQQASPPVVVAHSYGVQWVLPRLTPQTPLVALNGFARFTDAVPARVVQRMLKRFVSTPDAVIADFRASLMPPARQPSESLQPEGLLPAPPVTDPQALAEALHDLAHGDSRPALAPLLHRWAITGSDDPLAPPAQAEALVSGARNGKAILCAGGGHLLPLTHPAWVAEQLLAIWQDVKNLSDVQSPPAQVSAQ